MARPREFDPDQALDAILDVFWAVGFEETSMDDLVHKTGVSRYGLYNAFGNKKDLLKAALLRYCERMAKDHQQDLRRDDAGRKEMVDYLWSMVQMREADEGRGCFICKTVAEVAHHDVEIAASIMGLYEEHVGVFRNCIENAQKHGDIPASKDADELARAVMTLKIGITMLINANSDYSNIEASLKSGLQMLD